uniref:DUF4371 domain-containing protein n=1 Tax=Timema douglasi TaxID=61478 RepID=A0A7R8VGY6_TIMDO|nr:unnamed protein product [Timema douglasi]
MSNPRKACFQTIEKIKENIGDSYFWASVDETTDRCGRYIANIVVGKLDSTGPSSPHLIASRVLEVANSSTIARVVRDSLHYEEDAVSIREAKVATSSSTAVSDLAYVKSYFGNLPGVILLLEARDLPLIESVKIMHTIQEGVKQTTGPVASREMYPKYPVWRCLYQSKTVLVTTLSYPSSPPAIFTNFQFNECVSAIKEYNLKRHDESKHKPLENSYSRDLVLCVSKVESLTTLYQRGNSILVRALSQQEQATAASLRVAWLLTKNKKPFTNS